LIDEKFFDLVIYSIFKAINEKIGENTWEIVYRAGEIILDKIWDNLGLNNTADVIDGLNMIARWLTKVGYAEDLKFIKKGDGQLEYWMLNPKIADAAEELIDEGLVPPHTSTSILFAYLKRLGYRAEMVGGPIFREGGYIVENWLIKKID